MTEQHAGLTAAVVDSDDPIVRYKARRYLDGADPTSPTMQRLQDDIADSPIARGPSGRPRHEPTERPPGNVDDLPHVPVPRRHRLPTW
jgi:hypothetical protein